MPDTSDALGGRLALLDPEALSGEQKSAYDLINNTMVPWAESEGFQSRTEDGKLIGPFNGILHSPRITTAFLALQAAEQKNTTLSERVRQVVILTVGAVWRCDYERYAHAAVARKAGMAESAITALVKGDPATELGADEQLAQRFTHAIATEHRVDDALYSMAETAFGPQGIVDILYLAGCYGTISSLLNTFKVPAPMSSVT